MPIRSMRQRRNDGLKKFIPMLYQKSVLKFLSGEPWEPIADLIYGPIDIHLDKFLNESVRQKSREKLKALGVLWAELRDDILEAQEQYAPNKKPWGCRFDRKREAKRQ